MYFHIHSRLLPGALLILTAACATAPVSRERFVRESAGLRMSYPGMGTVVLEPTDAAARRWSNVLQLLEDVYPHALGRGSPLIVINGSQTLDDHDTLARIPVQDVTRVKVLRSLHAFALYGESASSGAILIETRVGPHRRASS